MHGTGSHNHSDSDFRRAESLAAARRPGCTESRQSQARAILRLAAAHLQPAAMIARLVRLAAARPGLRPAAAICPPHWQQVGRPGLHSESSPVSESRLPWERQPEPGSRVTRRAHGSSTAASRYTGTPGPLARQCHHGADDKGAEARRRAPGPPALGPSAWARRHHTARFQHGPAFRVTRARRSPGRWRAAVRRGHSRQPAGGPQPGSGFRVLRVRRSPPRTRRSPPGATRLPSPRPAQQPGFCGRSGPRPPVQAGPPGYSTPAVGPACRRAAARLPG